jgi:hypothetical protein
MTLVTVTAENPALKVGFIGASNNRKALRIAEKAHVGPKQKT